MSAMGTSIINMLRISGRDIGCQYVNCETLAIERAKELFGCTYANVPPPQVHKLILLCILHF